MMQWAQAKLTTARQGSPDDWELPFFLGKMAFKLGLVSKASSNLSPGLYLDPNPARSFDWYFFQPSSWA